MVSARRRYTPPDGETRRVEMGDSVPSIAYEHGHYWQTLWTHPKNEELRKKRGNPNILHEGDSVFVPPLEMETFSCETGKRHTFRRKGVPSVLRVRLFEPAPKNIHSLEWLLGKPAPHEPGAIPPKPKPKPWANKEYTLNVDGVESAGKTDGDGVVQVNVEPDARRATLVVAKGTEDERTLELHLGHIHPIDTMAGLRERLNNLGFSCEAAAEADADRALAGAIMRFQVTFDLEVTGDLDEKTARKLLEEHGS